MKQKIEIEYEDYTDKKLSKQKLEKLLKEKESEMMCQSQDLSKAFSAVEATGIICELLTLKIEHYCIIELLQITKG